MIVLQQTAQTLATNDGVVAWRLNARREDQHVAQALMVPLVVIVRHELANAVATSLRRPESTGSGTIL
jgi:hypothetical protein